MAGRGGTKIPMSTTTQAFFSRCQDFSPRFFQALYEDFTRRVTTLEKPAFGGEMRPVLNRFAGLWVVDGTKLDEIAHRLKLLWDDRAVILPGCLTAFYDVAYGITRFLRFYQDAAAGELSGAEELLPAIPRISPPKLSGTGSTAPSSPGPWPRGRGGGSSPISRSSLPTTGPVPSRTSSPSSPGNRRRGTGPTGRRPRGRSTENCTGTTLIGRLSDTHTGRQPHRFSAGKIQNYFSIMEDTLLGYCLPPFHRSLRKRQRKNPKFYLFDTGVKNALQHTLPYAMEPGTYPDGVAFEHWIISEFIRMNHYRRKDWQFSYLCTKDNAEIDLVVERAREPLLLIEIKSTASLHREDLTQFIKLSRDFTAAESYCLSNDRTRQKHEHVECLPWQEGLRAFFGA